MALPHTLAALTATVPLLVLSNGAQTLVKDFNTTPSDEVGSSSPGSFLPLPNGEVMFIASTPSTGTELWTSDGTAAGTQLLVEAQPGLPGSSPRLGVTLPNGITLFMATTIAQGWELWRTDGTAAGTSLVVDLYPGSTGSVGVGLTLVGNEAVFFANDGIHGIEPWRTDGTAAGTVMVKDVVVGGGMSNGTAQLARLGTNKFVFSALINSQWEIWKSDLTDAGTVSIAQLDSQLTSSPSYMTEFGNQVLFIARTPDGDQRWVTDGTPGGTFFLGAEGYGAFQVVGSTAYFRGYDPVARTEPWKTDGTVAGTMMLADLAPNAGFYQGSNPGFLGSIGNEVIFTAADDGIEHDLWKSDGTAAGTVKISEAALPGTFFGSDFGTTVGSEFFFKGYDGVNAGLWKTDGTGVGTVFVHPNLGFQLIPVGGTLLTWGDDPVTGFEPWITDGTFAGSQLLVDLVDSPATLDGYPAILGTFRDEAIVSADDGTIGRELWLTDGTTGGTRPLIDLHPGPDSTYVNQLLSNDELILFTATSSPFGLDPWVTDGTALGTQQLPLSATYPGFRMAWGHPFKDGFLINGITDADGGELWFTDGTLAGTTQILDIDTAPGEGSSPGEFFPWNGKALFLADNGTTGYEPWITDGTAAGTLQLAETNPGTNGVDHPQWVVAGDRVFFRGASIWTDSELWSTDGTPGGTAMLVDLLPGPMGSEPFPLVAVGDHVVFTAEVTSGQRQLYSTDGTPAGTTVLTSLIGEFFGPFRISDETAGFLVTASAAGQTYTTAWTTDGTPGGTGYRGPFAFAGPYWTDPANPTDDQVVFAVADAITGIELWTSDGSVSNTRALMDLAPQNAFPRQVTRVGDLVVFTADDGVHGNELFAFDLDLIGDETIDAFGFGVAGTNGVPTIDVAGEADASATLPFEIVVEDARASSAVFLAWSREPTAIPLASVTVWTGGNMQFVTGVSDPAGRAAFPFVPDPTLAGQRFVAQAFVLDPQGAALGVASATRGLELVLGP